MRCIHRLLENIASEYQEKRLSALPTTVTAQSHCPIFVRLYGLITPKKTTKWRRDSSSLIGTLVGSMALFSLGTRGPGPVAPDGGEHGFFSHHLPPFPPSLRQRHCARREGEWTHRILIPSLTSPLHPLGYPPSFSYLRRQSCALGSVLTSIRPTSSLGIECNHRLLSYITGVYLLLFLLVGNKLSWSGTEESRTLENGKFPG